MKVERIDEGPAPTITVAIRKSTHKRLQEYLKTLYPRSPLTEIASLAIDTYLEQMVGSREHPRTGGK